MKSPSIACLALLATLAAVTGCEHQHAAAEPEPPAKVTEGNKIVIQPGSAQLGILGIEAAGQPQAALLRLNGRLAWDDRATVRIFSPFGVRVVRVVAEPGATVHQGDPLAMVASPDFGQAQADARKATGDFTLAERTLSRVRDLLEHGAAPQKDLDQAEADLRTEVARQWPEIHLVPGYIWERGLVKLLRTNTIGWNSDGSVRRKIAITRPYASI